MALYEKRDDVYCGSCGHFTRHYIWRDGRQARNAPTVLSAPEPGPLRPSPHEGPAGGPVLPPVDPPHPGPGPAGHRLPGANAPDR